MLLYRKQIWKWRNRGLAALLLAALWLPLVGLFLHGRKDPGGERRGLAEMPPLSFKGRVWKEFPRRFELYFNDHFGFRSLLIDGSNVIKAHWMKVSTSVWVLIGKEPWLYYKPVPLAQMPGPFTRAELEAWQHMLEHRQQWLARRGCRYVLLMPPDKQTIYPQYLPDTVIPHANVSRLDQLLAHMRAHSQVPILDVRAELRAASQHERTYHITDSHWNERGAFVGYQKLGRQLHEWLPAVQPLPRSSFRDVSVLKKPGDLAEMLGDGHHPGEEWLNLEPLVARQARRTFEVPLPAKGEFPLGKPFATEHPGPGLPRAVMFHDSFNLPLQPFLSEHFRRIVYYWHDDFFADVVEHEHPDVVIQELLERKLITYKPVDFADR